MTGIYLKNKKSHDLFYAWLEQSIDNLKETCFIDCHIDAFYPSKFPEREIVQFAIDLYLELVVYSIHCQIFEDVMPILVIPLNISDNIDFYKEGLLEPDQLSIEPPSVYLFNRDVSKYIERVEEYKKPISIDLPVIDGCTFYSYYRCYRSDEYMENEWEFNRAIYIECYPIKYVF